MGYDVFRDITDALPVDFVVVKDNKFTRVQTKTYTETGDSVYLNREKVISRKKFLYTKEHVDVFAYYLQDKNIVVFVDIEVFGKRKNMTLSLVEPGGRLLSDQTWVRFPQGA